MTVINVQQAAIALFRRQEFTELRQVSFLMSKPKGSQKIPITSWQTEKFNVAIQTVRQLSEGLLSRDPHAPKIAGPVRFTPQIVQKPIALQPIVRGNTKWLKHCMNQAARLGITLEEFKRLRSQKMVRTYYKPRRK
jgi:hypothetical protein